MCYARITARNGSGLMCRAATPRSRFEALGCEVVLFNLLDIALAASFEDAVVDKVVKVRLAVQLRPRLLRSNMAPCLPPAEQAQERLIKQYQQQSSVIQKQTELILATAQRDIRVIQAVVRKRACCCVSEAAGLSMCPTPCTLLLFAYRTLPLIIRPPSVVVCRPPPLAW